MTHVPDARTARSFLLSAALLLVALVAAPSLHAQGGGRNMDPAARAQQQTEAISQKVQLTPQQSEQVKAILAGPTCDGIRRTAYGLAQAGAEYADHYRWKLNKETYFNRCVIRPEQLKRRAHTLALAAADGSL